MFHESNALLLDGPSPESFNEVRTESCSPLPGKPQPPAPDWLDRGQIPGLDGLRAIAVCLVMLVHCYRTPGFPNGIGILHIIATYGYFGVDVFFVISGFLITTLLARELDRTDCVNPKRFYLRRSLRIIPAYCSLMIVVAVCQWMGTCHLAPRDWICAMTYTSNFQYHPSWELGHSWSLAIEEHFYLLWPAALFTGGTAGGWRVATRCLIGCWLARCVVAFVIPHLVSAGDATWYVSMAETWTFTRLDTIAMGCLLALACRNDNLRAWLDRLTHPLLMAVYLAMICVSLDLGGRSTKYHLCASYTLNALCVALLMWGIIRSQGIMRRLLDNPVLRTIGLASYSLYLWQQLFIHPHRSGWIHEFPQNVGFAFAAAFLSYGLVERPFNRLKDRIAG